MSDQKIAEFRERAERSVIPVDPDQLLRRGTALRRRRQVAPLAALVAVAAIGYGLYTTVPPTYHSPAGEVVPGLVEVTMLSDVSRSGTVDPGTYPLEVNDVDGVPDAFVDVVGEGWQSFSSGTYRTGPDAVVSWSLAGYRDVSVDRCGGSTAGLEGGLTRTQVADRIASIAGTRVLQAPSPATFFELDAPATHLRISLPMTIRCGTGLNREGALDSMFPGSKDRRVTIDLWVLDHDGEVLLASTARRGEPTAAMLQDLTSTVESLRFTTAP